MKSVCISRERAVVWDGRLTHIYDLRQASRYQCSSENRLQDNGERCADAARITDCRIDLCAGTDAQIVDLQVSPDGKLALSAEGGVFFSPDSGETWQTVKAQGAAAIAISAQDSWAAVANDDQTITVYRYDRGEERRLTVMQTISLEESVSQLAISQAGRGHALVWLSERCGHGIVFVDEGGGYRSVKADAADELYEQCMQLKALSGEELSTEANGLRMMRAEQDDLRVARNTRLEVLLDRALSGHCARSVVRSIYWGQSDYLRAGEYPDAYMRGMDRERLAMPYRLRRSLRGRLKGLKLNVRVFFKRMRADAKRRKALRSLCYTLSDCPENVRFGYGYGLSVRMLLDRAARLMAESVGKEMNRELLRPSACCPENEENDLQLLVACSAAGEYIRERTLASFGGDLQIDPYRLGVIHAFKMEAARILLSMEEEAERDECLRQCCRAFLLVGIGRIRCDSRRSDYRRSESSEKQLCHAVGDALKALGRPLPAAALPAEKHGMEEKHED